MADLVLWKKRSRVLSFCTILVITKSTQRIKKEILLGTNRLAPIWKISTFCYCIDLCVLSLDINCSTDALLANFEEAIPKYHQQFIGKNSAKNQVGSFLRPFGKENEQIVYGQDVHNVTLTQLVWLTLVLLAVYHFVRE